jgi:hypothetical protein
MWKISMKPGGRSRSAGVGACAFIGCRKSGLELRHVPHLRPAVPAAHQGVSEVGPRASDARADFDWSEPDPRREFLRVKWNSDGGLDLYPRRIRRAYFDRLGRRAGGQPPNHAIPERRPGAFPAIRGALPVK